MRDFHHLCEDDTGVAILVEYILSIVIMAMFFSIMVLVMNSMITNADSIVVEQELGVVAHDITNRITSFSQTVSASKYQSDYLKRDVSVYGESIDLPDLVGGKPYTLTTSYDSSSKIGTVKVIYGLNPNINRTVSFTSDIEVDVTTVSSNGADLKIYYNSGKIKVGY